MRDLYPADAPPSLVIVVDEFATLVKEVPEFVDGIVDIAQRGRSLGIHLILATQRPSGAVNDNILANTNLRISLRMLDKSESMAVINSAEAAEIPVPLKGRGWVRLGPRALVAFQAAYCGSPLVSDDVQAPVLVAPFVRTDDSPKVLAGPTDRSRHPPRRRPAGDLRGQPPPRPAGRADAVARGAARAPDARRRARRSARRAGQCRAGQARRRRPGRRPRAPGPVPGADRPRGRVGLARVRLGRRRARRRCCARSPCRRSSPAGPTRSSSSASTSARAPSVRSPRCRRSSTSRPATTSRRSRVTSPCSTPSSNAGGTCSSAARAENLGSYNQRHDPLPRILVLVDGFGGFASTFIGGSSISSLVPLESWLERFINLVIDGRQVGIHVAMTADRRNAIPARLHSAVANRLILRAADEMGYTEHGDPAGAGQGARAGAGPRAVAGRRRGADRHRLGRPVERGPGGGDRRARRPGRAADDDRGCAAAPCPRS